MALPEEFLACGDHCSLRQHYQSGLQASRGIRAPSGWGTRAANAEFSGVVVPPAGYSMNCFAQLQSQTVGTTLNVEGQTIHVTLELLA